VRGRLCRRADLLAGIEAWRAWYDGPVIDFVSNVIAKRRMKAMTCWVIFGPAET